MAVELMNYALKALELNAQYVPKLSSFYPLVWGQCLEIASSLCSGITPDEAEGLDEMELEAVVSKVILLPSYFSSP